MARTRVEPDVEDVHLAFEGGAAALWTREAVGHERTRVPLVPSIGTVPLEYRGGLFDQLWCDDRCTTLCAVDCRNRHPPRSLPRNTPIGAALEHVEDAVVSPGWNPSDVMIDLIERRVP